MAQSTQKTIMDNFGAMLEEMPFDRITVSALVRRCGVSANTFYYHFDDIYDLLGKWLAERTAEYAVPPGGSADWREMARGILYRCRENKNIIYHVFNSLSRERLEQFAFAAADDVFYTFMRLVAADREVPEERLRELSDFCVYALLGRFLKFLWNRMRDDIDFMVDDIGTLVDELVSAELGKYPEKKQPVFDADGYLRAVLAQDGGAMRKYLRPDAKIYWPCTNECFDAEEFIAVNCAYPGRWSGEIERIVRTGDTCVVAAKVFQTDGGESFHSLAVITHDGERIKEITEYWGDDGAPPAWRGDKYIMK